jgi:SAM-dependent methyltransferase
MDSLTASFYQKHAANVVARYEAVDSPIERYFPAAFSAGNRVLDVGCGSGRDLARLLAHGYDGYGIEPSSAMREYAVSVHPELSGRISEGSLPDVGQPFAGQFDGIVCSAVLMHVPSKDLIEAVLSLRSLLVDRGRLLLSLPASRAEDLVDHRDASGRLFSPFTVGEISLLFERFGFRPIGQWSTDDSLMRQGTSWYTLLFELQGQGTQRPIDQIETILNRDRKEATYKLALIRALAEIATQEARCASWLPGHEVGIPIDRIAERWLLYYWPLMAFDRSVPQSKAEGAEGKPLKFRESLTTLIHGFQGQGQHGGLTSWHLARSSGRLDHKAASLLKRVLRDIVDAIRSGPVQFSGGALESGRVFTYDAKSRQVRMSVDLWREFSLLGHWIRDAVIVRWAELTARFAYRQGLSSADVLPLLLAQPEAERATMPARQTFESEGWKECAWTGKRLASGFAVDHVIPFSLWGNNDLWNLVPADHRVNLNKSDKLPARDLLWERQSAIVCCWEALRDRMPLPFDQKAEYLLGERLGVLGRWQETLFARLSDAIEITAVQRGVERWRPVGKAR